MRFWKRSDDRDLESRLRASRPEAPADLVRKISGRVAPRPVGRRAIAFASVLTVALLGALAAFGGLGYAADTVTSAVKSATAPLTTNTYNGGSHTTTTTTTTCGPACDQYGQKGKIIVVKKTYPYGGTGFVFSGDLAGTINDGGSIAKVVAAGTYHTTEAVKADWKLYSISCSDSNSTGSTTTRTATFNVSPGETVTCTFTNKKAVLDLKCASTCGTTDKSFSGVVANLTDTDTSMGASDYTATIDWGDGNTSAGTVTGSNGSFKVSGSHNYSSTGSFSIKVTVKASDGRTISVTCKTVVSAPKLNLTCSSTCGSTGKYFNGVVANLSDEDKTTTTSSFTATIDWGDGTSASTGTVTGSNGSFKISGSHNYSKIGTYYIKVTVTAKDKRTDTVTCKTVVHS